MLLAARESSISGLMDAVQNVWNYIDSMTKEKRLLLAEIFLNNLYTKWFANQESKHAVENVEKKSNLESILFLKVFLEYLEDNSDWHWKQGTERPDGEWLGIEVHRRPISFVVLFSLNRKCV